MNLPFNIHKDEREPWKVMTMPGYWQVYDSRQKEGQISMRIICKCGTEADANLISKLLNNQNNTVNAGKHPWRDRHRQG